MINHLQITFENVEAIIIPAMYINDINFDVIEEAVRLEKYNIIKKHKIIKQGRLIIYQSFQEDQSYQPYFFSKEYTVYNRLKIFQDITDIEIFYDDYTYDNYYPIWDISSNEINKYQKMCEYDDVLRIDFNG